MSIEKRIEESKKFITELFEENELMQSSINVESENFEGSDDESCFRNHERIMLRCDIIIDLLTRYDAARCSLSNKVLSLNGDL